MFGDVWCFRVIFFRFDVELVVFVFFNFFVFFIFCFFSYFVSCISAAMAVGYCCLISFLAVFSFVLFR